MAAEPLDPAPYAEHWYQVVPGEDLRQGDIFRDIPLFRLADELQADGPPLVARSQGSVIVTSASCDLDQDRVTGVSVSMVFEASPERLGASKSSDYRRRLEILRQQMYRSRFLLPGFDGIEPMFPWSFVEARQGFFLPRPYLLGIAGGRLRLRHPFREQFGNWVGRLASDVGPEDAVAIGKIVSPGGTQNLLDAAAAHDSPLEVNEEVIEVDEVGS